MRTRSMLPGRSCFFLAILLMQGLWALAQVRPDDQNQLSSPLPDPLLTLDGTPVSGSELWENQRREEVLDLFREHVYGRIPEMDLEVDQAVDFLDRHALDGKAVIKEVVLEVKGEGKSLPIRILIFLPADASGPVPLFLGLNFYGNHTIHPDPRISLAHSWVGNNEDFHITENRATEASRGVRAHRWPVDLILDRGYGLATIYYGDIDPDMHDGFLNGIHALDGVDAEQRTSDSWGSIAAWAWGLSRAMDYLERDADVDASRVAVIGHSRLGKTSLWAGALDERFAMVVSNNSGCGGAALSRRPFGESVKAINERFPHWFASRFSDYNDKEADCPVDQHMLLGLVAPRPLYVASASEDLWADPYGEYLSLCYGSGVYGLYGKEVPVDLSPPEADRPRKVGKLGYHVRTGKHDITVYDWTQYLDFADEQLGAGQAASDFGNPVNTEWLDQHLKKEHPRLILTPEVEEVVKLKLEAGDLSTVQGLNLLKASADKLLNQPPLEFKKTGRRLLGVSREALRRTTTLALVYRFQRDSRHLERLEEELEAVCGFDHWNPDHFLDVGEMAVAVALPLDWVGEDLDAELVVMARKALVEKALKPGVAGNSNNFWLHVHHNWNLVCNGGLAMAALTVYEDEPELASRILEQAVGTIPLALEPYAPDGVYPEGASYWFYATSYLAATISAFESALGTDFGFSEAAGLRESAVFSLVLAGPSGEYYNFFDAGSGGYYGLTHLGLLAWFARRGGDGVDLAAYADLLEREEDNPRQSGSNRFYPYFFLELALVEDEQVGGKDLPQIPHLPATWVAEGEEPLGIFRDPDRDPASLFLAAKGGCAGDNHGNMDAGSFILELDGVRWSVDPGNQSYHELEQILGSGLWQNAQDSPRWTLLTKNNFGHSTLTVNDEMHRVDGRALLVHKDLRGEKPVFGFDLTSLFGGVLEEATRSFVRTGPEELLIRDHLQAGVDARNMCWQMITTAAVEVLPDGARLMQEGKELRLHILGELPAEIRVVDLSPPPLDYDKDIEGLKRIELRYGPGDLPGEIRVKLSRK